MTYFNIWIMWYIMYLILHVRLFATPWTIACQAPLLMEFSRQEYWSELPFLQFHINKPLLIMNKCWLNIYILTHAGIRFCIMHLSCDNRLNFSQVCEMRKKNTFNVVKFSKGNSGKGKILIAYRLKDGRWNLKCLKFKTQNISRNTEKQTNVQGFHP